MGIIENCQCMVIRKSTLTFSQCCFCKILQRLCTPCLPAPGVGGSHTASLRTLLAERCVYHPPYLLTRGVGYRGVVWAQERSSVYLCDYVSITFINFLMLFETDLSLTLLWAQRTLLSVGPCSCSWLGWLHLLYRWSFMNPVSPQETKVYVQVVAVRVPLCL